MIARYLLLGGLLVSSFFPVAAQAQTIEAEYAEIKGEGLIFANVCEHQGGSTECTCKSKGKCSIEQLLQVVVNVSYFILAISGSVAFAIFFYGGIMWLVSAGNPDMVKKGRSAISGAVIGLVIIFSSYVLINLVIGILKLGSVQSGSIETTLGDDANDVILTQ